MKRLALAFVLASCTTPRCNGPNAVVNDSGFRIHVASSMAGASGDFTCSFLAGGQDMENGKPLGSPSPGFWACSK